MKKSLAFLTGICLVLSSGLASAVTLNGWDVGNPTAVRASGLVNGSKTFGDVTKTSKALITPNASQVSKILRGGVAGVALTVAVNELLDGVDWVLDPANNQIKYKIPSTDPLDPTNQYYYVSVYDPQTRSPSLQGAIDKAAAHYCKINSYTECTGKVISQTAVDSWKVEFCRLGPVKGCLNNNAGRLANPTYDSTVEKEKTLPLDTASQKVIDNAQSGNTDAQVATVAAAQNILNEAENDAEKAKPIVQQLENNSTDLNPPALLSKGRKQNIDNEYVRSVQNKENGDEDPCEWLKNLRNSEPDKAIKKKIKTAEKRFNCDGKNRFDKN